MVAAGGARAGGGDAGTAAARLAWTALGGSLLLVAVGVGLRELGPRAGAYPFWGEVTVIVVVLGTLGALVAARRPGHPVGWLFAGIGLAGAVQLVAGNYAMAARADPALPAGAVAALAAEELRIVGFGAELAAIGSLVVRFWQARGVERQQLNSTGPATTPSARSSGSGPACGTSSTWTPCPRSCWPWSTAPSSQRRARCGCGPGIPRP
jgi:hypothetical protein